MHIFSYCVSTMIIFFLNKFQKITGSSKYFRKADIIFLIYIILGISSVINIRIDGLETIFTSFKIIKINFTEYLIMILLLFIYFIYLRKKKSVIQKTFQQTCQSSMKHFEKHTSSSKIE